MDCIWIDMEHVPNNYESIENAIRAAKIYDCDTLTRVAKGGYNDLVRPRRLIPPASWCPT